MVTIQVNGQIMKAICCDKIVADSINMLEFKFNFSAEWKGLVKTAQFTQVQEDEPQTYNMAIDSAGLADFPNEIIEGPFTVSVFGVDGNVRRLTTAPLAYTLEKSGYVPDGKTPIPPTPDLYQQLVMQVINTAGSPVIGENGNWFLDNMDTGVKADWSAEQENAATSAAEATAAAAEAKAVQESIPEDYSELSKTVEQHSAMMSICEENGNEMDIAWAIGTIKSADGTDSSSTSRMRTSYLPIGNIAVLVGNDAKCSLYFYDENKNYLSDAHIAFTTETVNIGEKAPANAAFYRLVAATRNDEVLTDKTEALAEQVRLITAIRPHMEELHQAAIEHADRVAPKIEMLLITEFEYIPGRWDLVGGLSGTAWHTQPVPVKEGETYYIGYRGLNATCSGAFLDCAGNWLQELRKSETVVHEYKTADGNKKLSDYAEIYAFTVPAGARYISLNLTDADDNKYRQYIASKPVFALENTGNFIVYEGNPAYQAKKGKSLCVIGASGVAIDRLYTEDISQNIVGFQEYLAPWYKNVESYGFWSGSWANKNQEDNSIYNGIVGANADLTAYDEFLLIPSTAEIAKESDIGEITSTDHLTYMGGLNGVIEYIYTQVPNAKIYLANVLHKGKYFTSDTTKALMDDINEKLAKLSALKSYQLIDLASGTGINDRTYQAMTYDGTHLNQEGNKAQGLYIRKEIIGI